MALNPGFEKMLIVDSDTFDREEISIRKTFSSLINELTNRRDQLLVELHKLRDKYLSSEETRKNDLKQLDQIIKQREQESIKSIKENLIVSIHKDNIKDLKEGREKLKQPIPILNPPHFDTSQVEELSQQIRKFGSLEKDYNPYATKLMPIESLGKKGTGSEEVGYPYGVVTDEEGNIFIADSQNHRIQLMNLKGQFIGEFGKGEISWPHSLALYQGWLFATDYDRHKVIRIQIQNFQVECKSESDLKLSFPSGIAVDEKEVFVADCSNNRIVVLSLDLKYARELGKDQLKAPRGVQVNMDKLFIADNSKSNNIHVFSKSGELLKNMIILGNGTSTIFLCFDWLNHILVSDWSGKKIEIYTSEGELVHVIECDYKPTGIAVFPQDNRIICCDYTNHTINMY